MICKERSIGLPWFSTKTQIMTLFYLASRAANQLIYSTEHVFEQFRGFCPVALPLIAGVISQQDLSVSLSNKRCKSLGSRPKRSININLLHKPDN